MRHAFVSPVGPLGHGAPAWRRPRGRAVLVILIGLALAPLVSEASALGAARWASLYGPQRSVKTPTMDALSRSASVAYNGVTRLATRPLRYLPWKPGWVIAVAAVWVVIGTYLLRRL